MHERSSVGARGDMMYATMRMTRWRVRCTQLPKMLVLQQSSSPLVFTLTARIIVIQKSMNTMNTNHTMKTIDPINTSLTL